MPQHKAGNALPTTAYPAVERAQGLAPLIEGGDSRMNLLHEIGPHLSGLEQLKAMLAADRRPGIGETLDIRLVEVEDGRAVLEATPGVHLYNPVGTVHGGFAATMLDFACAYAV